MIERCLWIRLRTRDAKRHPHGLRRHILDAGRPIIKDQHQLAWSLAADGHCVPGRTGRWRETRIAHALGQSLGRRVFRPIRRHRVHRVLAARRFVQRPPRTCGGPRNSRAGRAGSHRASRLLPARRSPRRSTRGSQGRSRPRGSQPQRSPVQPRSRVPHGPCPSSDRRRRSRRRTRARTSVGACARA
ncbi:MAG: hypothetical protein H6Q90_7195 [Deltaproteobacteria bacterium]|nr:hypothetical protein [Deltaproteobacteria bacterium]